MSVLRLVVVRGRHRLTLLNFPILLVVQLNRNLGRSIRIHSLAELTSLERFLIIFVLIVLSGGGVSIRGGRCG